MGGVATQKLRTISTKRRQLARDSQRPTRLTDVDEFIETVNRDSM